MLNIEKYKDEIIEEALDDKFCSIAKLAQGDPCCFHQKDNCEDCVLNTIEWLLGEYKEPILTDYEKGYLSDVIRPFRKSVTYISKLPFSETDRQFISITVMNERGRRECVNLPNFETGTMYKGMKPNKPYKLEELGL